MKNNILELRGVYQKYLDKEQKDKKKDIRPILKRIFEKKPLTDKEKGLRIILNDINVQINPGEFVTIVGTSGCGKSTLFRMLLGSEKPICGQALMDGVEIQEPDPTRGIVFQNYSLFPFLTVLENVMIGPMMQQFNMTDIFFRRSNADREIVKKFETIAKDYLEEVGLCEHCDKYIHQLSGGMRQRAAIAQATITKPRVLMMDEPFGALDDSTRAEMQLFILEQWKKHGMTILFVTHELEEAVFLGNRIIVLSKFRQDNGEIGEGAKIVKDMPINWSMPRQMNIKYSPEFNELLAEIREWTDKNHMPHIKDFDLRYRS